MATGDGVAVGVGVGVGVTAGVDPPPESGAGVGGSAVVYSNPAVRGTTAVPSTDVTVTSTKPTACAGVVAVIWVNESMTTDAAAVPPKVTVVPGM